MNPLKYVPGLRRWKRDKKHLIQILIPMALSFFLVEMTFLLGDSLEVSLRERRLDAYGEWQFAFFNLNPEYEKVVRANPFLEECGNISGQAVLINDGLDAEYAVGSIEASALGISRIHLQQGRMPERAGEAAVEASVLLRLGAESVLGETITLEIQPLDEDGQRIPEAKSEVREVTLCGILEDYAANWCIRNQVPLPSVLVSGDFLSESEWPACRCLLLTGDDSRYALGELESNFCAGVVTLAKPERNVFAYPRQETDTIASAMRLLRVLGGLLAVIILNITLISSVRSRREEWRSLVLLGATRGKLRYLLIEEALLLGVISLVLGIGGSLLGFFVLHPLLEQGIGFPLQVGFSWQHLGVAVGTGCGTAFVSYGISCLQIKRLSQPSLNRKVRRGRFGRRKGRERGQVTFLTVWLRQWSSYPWLRALQFVLLCGMLLLPCFGLRIIDEKNRLLQAELDLYGESYTLKNSGMVGSPFSRYSPLGISKERLPAIHEIYGVSGYEAHQRTSPEELFFIDLSVWKDTEYARLAGEEQCLRMENLRQEYTTLTGSGDSEENGEKKILLDNAIAGISNGVMHTVLRTVSSEEELELFTRNLSKGTVDKEAFWSGEAAILYLPPLSVKEEEGIPYVTSSFTEKDRKFYEEEGWKTVWEESIPAEAQVEVSYLLAGEAESIKIAGILSEFAEEDISGSLILSNYMLICSEAFIHRFSWPSKECYQYVQVNASLEAGYGTDTQVAVALYSSSSMDYVNHREQIAALRQEFYLTLVLAGSLSVLGVCLLAIILAGISRTSRFYQRECLGTMRALGMKKSWQSFFSLSQSGILSVLAILAVTMGFSVQEYGRMVRSFEEYAYIPPQFKLFVGYFPSWMYVGACVLMIVIGYICMNDKK